MGFVRLRQVIKHFRCKSHVKSRKNVFKLHQGCRTKNRGYRKGSLAAEGQRRVRWIQPVFFGNADIGRNRSRGTW